MLLYTRVASTTTTARMKKGKKRQTSKYQKYFAICRSTWIAWATSIRYKLIRINVFGYRLAVSFGFTAKHKQFWITIVLTDQSTQPHPNSRCTHSPRVWVVSAWKWRIQTDRSSSPFKAPWDARAPKRRRSNQIKIKNVKHAPMCPSPFWICNSIDDRQLIIVHDSLFCFCFKDLIDVVRMHRNRDGLYLICHLFSTYLIQPSGTASHTIDKTTHYIQNVLHISWLGHSRNANPAMAVVDDATKLDKAKNSWYQNKQHRNDDAVAGRRKKRGR